MTQTDVTVYIGRFNPFHNGHAHVLRQALTTSKVVIVLVGSADKARSPRNPFNFAERRGMIERWASTINHNAMLRVVPLRDRSSNSVWIQSVQKSVKDVLTSVARTTLVHGQQVELLTDIRIIGSDRDESTWYLSSFPQWKLELVPPLEQHSDIARDLSATSVRKTLYEDSLVHMPQRLEALSHKLPRTTIDFLQRFITEQLDTLLALRQEHEFIQRGKAAWRNAPYRPTFQTADAVIIQSGHVLVIRRANQPGRGLWALPGGYVNQTETIRDAAVREAIEETGIRLTEGKKWREITERMLRGSIVDHEIFDAPNRSERGRIITCAFLIRLDDTKPLPPVSGQLVPEHEAEFSGELETFEAVWLPLSRALDEPTLWFEDHYQILEHFLSRKDV